MTIEKTTSAIKCSCENCHNLATTSITIAIKKNFNLCNSCIKNLYQYIGKKLIPKSPDNILKNIKIIKGN